MNSLKNLLIIAVLGAVGYGVYVSLARNNADNNQPPGVAEGWPTVPKVELPSANATLPPAGTLAGSGNPRPGGTPLPLAPPVHRRSQRQSTGRSGSHGARSAFAASGHPFGGGVVEPGRNLGHTDAARRRVDCTGSHPGRAREASRRPTRCVIRWPLRRRQVRRRQPRTLPWASCRVSLPP